jgi:hypothetical protein
MIVPSINAARCHDCSFLHRPEPASHYEVTSRKTQIHPGQCRRHPPLSTSGPDQWPAVSGHGSCGEFVASAAVLEKLEAEVRKASPSTADELRMPIWMRLMNRANAAGSQT